VDRRRLTPSERARSAVVGSAYPGHRSVGSAAEVAEQGPGAFGAPFHLHRVELSRLTGEIECSGGVSGGGLVDRRQRRRLRLLPKAIERLSFHEHGNEVTDGVVDEAIADLGDHRLDALGGYRWEASSEAADDVRDRGVFIEFAHDGIVRGSPQSRNADADVR